MSKKPNLYKTVNSADSSTMERFSKLNQQIDLLYQKRWVNQNDDLENDYLKDKKYGVKK